MSMSKPTVSVITVTYNAEKYLPSTIKSVLAQTYPNIEFLIVDGQSTDSTLAIIKNHKSKISKWVSEPDKGLYDAMNKGLRLATGDFVIFMNAGDSFYEADTITNCFKKYTEDTDIIYGNTMLTNEQYEPLGLRKEITTRNLPENLNWKSLKQGMLVCHQSIFVRKRIASDYLNNNLSADIDWVINALKKSRNTVYSGFTVSNFMLGGISKQNHWTSLKDRFKVLKRHYGLFNTLIAHLNIVIRFLSFKFRKAF